MEVYILFHINKLNEDDFKLIGVYSSKENAQKAKKRIKKLPGFLDKDNWQEGFITV